jgi:hypothetical protein
MAKTSPNSGSDWHLLRFLGRQRHRLDRAVLHAVDRGTRLDWLDAPLADDDAENPDRLWRDIEFLAHKPELKAAWEEFWPGASAAIDWDAVAWIRGEGPPELLLVAGASSVQDLKSNLGPRETRDGGRPKIVKAFKDAMADLGVKYGDWKEGHYAYCARVAALWFLRQQGVPARLLHIYFTGDSGDDRRTCPGSEAGWAKPLAKMDKDVGLPTWHPLAQWMHRLFLPVGANGR